MSHYIDSDEVGDFFIDLFNSGFDTDSFFIRVNEMPTSWQYKFFDNDTGMELTEEGINSVTPDIGSHDILTIRMEVYPPADREAQDIGLVSLQVTSSGDSELQTDSKLYCASDFWHPSRNNIRQRWRGFGDGWANRPRRIAQLYNQNIRH